MSQTRVTPLGLRLFLEGIEIPVISAQVNLQPDQPASASVQVVPSDMAVHLLPRTLVHLFYLDDLDVNIAGSGSLPTVAEPPRVNPGVDKTAESNSNRFSALDEQYKLLFSGEVIGFNYGKTPDRRQLVLQCLDLSSYWDTCYQWFADYSVGGNGLTDKSHNFAGAGIARFNSISGGHQSVIGRLIETKPKNPKYQNATGLLGGILHILEAIGGITYKSSGEPGFNGVNDFFTIAELRYNLLGMIGAVEADETSAKLYAHKAFRSWLRNGMTSLGTLLSFRDIINHVNRHIFHHIYPNPCAYLDTGERKEIRVGKSIYTDGPTGSAVRLDIRAAVQAMYKARKSFDLAAVGISDNFASGVRSTKLADVILREARSKMDKISTDDKSIIISAITEAKALTEDSLRTIKETGFDEETEGTLPGFTEKTTPVGEITNVSEKVELFLSDAVDILDGKILNSKSRAQRITNKTITSYVSPHLYNQLILPETFFVSPPTCNVIFPDQYSQFSYSRNFLREVSRLMCRGGLGMIAGGRRGADILGA